MVLVEPVEDKQSSTIVIPDTAYKELQSVCRVVAVGKGKIKALKGGGILRLNPEVGVGMKVVVNTYAGKEVGVDNRKMRLVHFDSIQAIIDDV